MPIRILIISLLLCLAGCGDTLHYLTSGEVSWALKKEVRDKRSKDIVLANLTSFQWDEFFVFGPYEPKEDICKFLKILPSKCEDSEVEDSVDDGVMIMVFRNNGEIAHVERHIRLYGDFPPLPEAALTPATALFSVSAEGKSANGEIWLRLHLAGPGISTN